MPIPAIQSHIDADMVLRIHSRTLPLESTGVIGRKDAADKRNDGQGMVAVVADRIEIPPAITTRRDGLVESR